MRVTYTAAHHRLANSIAIIVDVQLSEQAGYTSQRLLDMQRILHRNPTLPALALAIVRATLKAREQLEEEVARLDHERQLPNEAEGQAEDDI